MKLRNKEQLNSELDKELIWRKKELMDFKSLIGIKSNSNSKRKALLRAGVNLLYAHYEGFCKNASEFYLNYVSFQRLRNNELKDNWLIISQLGMYNDVQSSKVYEIHFKLTNFLVNAGSQRSKIPYVGVIDTGSNLSSKYLENIMLLLGLDFGEIETKRKIIDEKLLKNRNMIAHGEYVEIDDRGFDELFTEIMYIMNNVRNQIDNSVQMESYKK